MVEPKTRDDGEHDEHKKNDVARKSKIVEPDPADTPQRGRSQVPDVNPGKVQPGHRDREEI